MGFDFSDRMNKYDWSAVRDALVTFKGIQGDTLVPYSFIIPSGDSQWAERLWGMKLGQVVSGIRVKGYYSGHREELQSLGFVFDKQRNRSCWRKPKPLPLESS
jgi:hypothetical protein